MSDRTSIYHAGLLFRAVNLCPIGHKWERGWLIPRHLRFARCRGLRRNRCPSDIPSLPRPCLIPISLVNPLYLTPSLPPFYLPHFSALSRSVPPSTLSHPFLPPYLVPFTSSHSAHHYIIPPLSCLFFHPIPSIPHPVFLSSLIPSSSIPPLFPMSSSPLVVLVAYCAFLMDSP